MDLGPNYVLPAVPVDPPGDCSVLNPEPYKLVDTGLM